MGVSTWSIFIGFISLSSPLFTTKVNPSLSKDSSSSQSSSRARPREGPDHPPCDRATLMKGLSSLSLRKSLITSVAFSVTSNMFICLHMKVLLVFLNIVIRICLSNNRHNCLTKKSVKSLLRGKLRISENRQWRD